MMPIGLIMPIAPRACPPGMAPQFIPNLTTTFNYGAYNSVWALRSIANTFSRSSADFFSKAHLIRLLIHFMGDLGSPASHSSHSRMRPATQSSPGSGAAPVISCLT